MSTAPWAEATARLPMTGRCVGVQRTPGGGVWLFRRDPLNSRSAELHLSLADLQGATAASTPKDRAVAVWVPTERFERWLQLAVNVEWDSACYSMRQAWRLAVRFARVRLQWVPERDPSGAPLTRQTARIKLAPDLTNELMKQGSAPPFAVDSLLASLAHRAPVRQPYPIEDPDLRLRLFGEGA